MNKNHFRVKRTAKVVFDTAKNDSAGVSNKTIAAHGTGVILPAGAIIVDSAYDVSTTFTSATDAGEVAFASEGAGDIKAATAISTGTTYDDVTSMVAGTPVSAATAVKLTANREITATVTVEALTAGRLVWYIDYVL